MTPFKRCANSKYGTKNMTQTQPDQPRPRSSGDEAGGNPNRNQADILRRAAELHRDGKHQEAEAILREATAANPGDVDLWNARGVMFAGMSRFTDAVWCYREALAISPRSSGAWTNLGNALTELKHLRSAVACHQKAVNLSPNDPLLHYNLGVSLSAAHCHGEAVAEFTHALKIKPNYHAARWDRAHSYLYLGNYHEGWADYEVRLITGQLPQRSLPGVKWDGSPYGGRRLLIVAEQGFGDALWVARYLPRIKALGGELLVECGRELVPLLSSMGVVDRFVPRNDPLPDADFHCHLCSIPGLFTSAATKIPAAPYLTASNDRAGKFSRLVRRGGRQLNVGIVWSGSVTFKKNKERAQNLMRFLEAFAIPGVKLFSLQKGPPTKDLHRLPKGSPIVDLSPLIDDFADTAAAVAELDLIIMTDSAVAHLAGAMGKSVWLLLGYKAYWLWLLEQNDSPWYPSMRLFRPRAEGDWDYVFDSAAAELMRLLDRKS